VPNRQNCPGGHALPQVPQFASSRLRFLHPPGQHANAFESQHFPLQHVPVSKGPLHLLPHLPQLRRSEAVSTISSLQQLFPSPVVSGLPPQQVWFLGLMQVRPHFSRLSGQRERQFPWKQTCLRPHLFPHLPQLRASESRSVHLPPQQAGSLRLGLPSQ
jgi:hypothetical protein